MVVAMLCVLVPLVQAQESKLHPNCMSECDFQCMQIKIFTWSECRSECTMACKKLYDGNGVQQKHRKEKAGYDI
ncbi:hypothetical protein U1Q18_023187, partial [Sarracenia purpurea var. burkii]